MNYKTVLLTLVLAIGFSLPSCYDDDDCNCAPLIGEYFDIEGISLAFRQKIGDKYEEIIQGEVVAFDNFDAMVINYQVDYHSTNCRKKSSFLMNSAWACSCLYNGVSGSKTEKIENLEVITLYDHNDFDLSGESIKELVDIYDWSLNDYMDLNTFLEQDSSLIQTEVFFLKLKNRPILNDTFQVRIEIELTDNEVYTVESVPFIITD